MAELSYYVVLEGEVGGDTMKVLSDGPQDGLYPATSRDEACALAAANGEEDGEPRSGRFRAVAYSNWGGQDFVKAVRPVVNAAASRDFAPPPKAPREPKPKPIPGQTTVEEQLAAKNAAAAAANGEGVAATPQAAPAGATP